MYYNVVFVMKLTKYRSLSLVTPGPKTGQGCSRRDTLHPLDGNCERLADGRTISTWCKDIDREVAEFHKGVVVEEQFDRNGS